MERITTRTDARPSQVFTQPTTRARPASRFWLATGLGFALGIAFGILELVVFAWRAWWFPAWNIGETHFHDMAAWMVPAADTIVLGSAGVLLGAILHRRASRPFAVFATTLTVSILGWYSVLHSIRVIHLAAVWILAAGLAYRMARWASRRADRVESVLKRSVGWMGLGLVAWIVAVSLVIVTREARAIASLPPPGPDRPNVLLIVLDTVRADRMSLNGYHRDTTPNLVRYARRGIRFEDARACAPWTYPSHASLFTGRWPFELGFRQSRPIDPNAPTLAEVLAERGYSTAGFIANPHFFDLTRGLGRGFARWEGQDKSRKVSWNTVLKASTLGGNVHRTLAWMTGRDLGLVDVVRRKRADRITNDALTWIAGQPDGERPFFVFLNYFDSHFPYMPAPEYTLQFAERRVMDPLPYVRLSKARMRVNPDAPPLTPEEDRELAGFERIFNDLYDDTVAYVDQQLGILLDTLERQGKLRDTWVIITSDHGEHLGEHGLFGHAMSLHTELTRVPLLILPPTDAPTSVRSVADPVSLRDVAPTILEAVDPDASIFPGQPLSRYWRSDESEPPGPNLVISEVEHMPAFAPESIVPAGRGPMQSIIGTERLYIHQGDGRDQLFDRVNDPVEAKDLADSPEERPVLDGLRRKRSELWPGLP